MNNLIDNRQIRIFISSTFRDMQDERDYLMKRTFPKLRKLAAERDVILTELDLRWGITEEESKSGKVVEICLREIENSIPFFIGIIGNRYGWVPAREDLGGNVTERFAEVNKYIEQHLSVTEMEMQFGVLSREEDMHAYFYIKEQEEDAEKIDYPEMLKRLKEDVCKSKYPSSVYKSPEDLATQVEDAFINLLDTLFPKGNLTELEKERIGQRSFMNQLCQNYIRDEKNFDPLDAWLTDDAVRQFVVTGGSGLGKSALIANWVKEKLNDPDCGHNIIYHFTGNGGSESNSEHITKSLIKEINDLYGWEDADSESKLDELFLRVSAEGDKPLLIVIDAINQIVDVDNAKLLNWLPIPTKNIKILFSTLEDDRTMEVFKNRHYPIFTLQSLDQERRSLLVKNYLKLYAKKLTDKQIERIVTDSQCENTLVLKTLLDNLINFGIFEKLDERIEYYLASDTIDDFYQALLALYEEEYDDCGNAIVRKVLSIIAVSHDGLKEEDIIKIAQIKPLYWSQLYCALSVFFCNKLGRISFSHSHIRSSIERRYKLNEQGIGYRMDILRYSKLLIQLGDSTCFLEILYQLYKINTKESAALLFNNLKYPTVTAKLYEQEESNCIEYWKFLLKNGYSFDCFEQYKEDIIAEDFVTKEVIKEGSYHDIQLMLYNLRNLLHSFGEFPISLSLMKLFLGFLESNPNTSTDAKARAIIAVADELMSETSNRSEAKDFYIAAIELAKNNALPTLSASYNGLARICIEDNHIESAIEAAKAALEFSIENFGRIHQETGTSYSSLANAYDVVGKYEEAIDCHSRAINIIKTLFGEQCPQLIIAYYNLADSQYYNKQYKEALLSIESSLKIIKGLFGDDYFDLQSYLVLRQSIVERIQ